jgi:hypothetical protein
MKRKIKPEWALQNTVYFTTAPSGFEATKTETNRITKFASMLYSCEMHYFL